MDPRLHRRVEGFDPVGCQDLGVLVYRVRLAD